VEATRGFPEAWAGLADVGGWLSRSQAGRLWDRASELEAGDRIVEIGSFHGRSAIILATAAPPGVAVTTIDPHGGNDRGPQEISGFEAEAELDHQLFLANLEDAGVSGRIEHLRAFSEDVVDEVPAPVQLLYVDGAHRFGPARADIRDWGAKVPVGGRLLVHDSFSSVGVTLALVVETMLTRRWRYVGRSRSLAEYERADLAAPEWLANVGRQLAQLPWFVRNLVIKVLVAVGLGRVTRFLGHDGGWPY